MLKKIFRLVRRLMLWWKLEVLQLTIQLNDINPDADSLPEALKMSINEYRTVVEFLFEIYPQLSMLASRLNLPLEQLLEQTKTPSNYVQAMVAIWSKRQRTSVTLEEAVGTIILLKMLQRLPATIVLIELEEASFSPKVSLN